jgi:thymidylate synthase
LPIQARLPGNLHWGFGQMEIEAESLDDILIGLYEVLSNRGRPNKASRGDTLELLGVSIRLRNPRARLSRSENRGKPFSALGELLWYLAGRNDLLFIKPYISAYQNEADDDGTIYGGYGPRLLAMRGHINQITSVIELLKRNPGSRRAVIQLFNADDITSAKKEVPCTTTMQFFQREGELHMAATLRSNDSYKGLPHDVFCFTMLQEMIATKLELGIGEYYQFIGSMHVYTDDLDELNEYVEEGYRLQ